MTVPGPFTMSQQAQNDYYPSREEAAFGYAEAVNEEVKDLFAAGADIVQLDEPYLQARPDEARGYGVPAVNRALEGAAGTTAVHLCFGNYGGQTIQKGEWKALTDFLNQLHVDHLILEMAHRSTADLEALNEVDPRIRLGVHAR